MPIIAQKCRDQKPSDTPRGISVTELWEVAYFNSDGFTYNFNGVIDPDLIISTPGYAANLPNYGDQHPAHPSALVVDRQVSQVFANWSVFVLVTWRSWGLYSGGPRAITASYGASFDVDVPVYQRQEVTPGVSWYVQRPFNWKRERITRVETRFLGGNQVATVQRAISRSVGGWYNFDGDFYLLSGQTSAVYDGHAYTRVNYAFDTWARFPGAGAGDPVLKNDIAIPDLGNLETWQVAFPNNDPSQPPAINRVPLIAFASQGLPLPGFP